MAAFIVISADNRLHYLVDGIEKCRPLNPDVFTSISTGKIVQSDDDCSCIYEYTIHGEGTKNDEAKPFNNLLANQLAAFRLAHHMTDKQLVNIFFLENPLTENEYERSKEWMQEFDKVYDSGHGSDTSFCLYRILFTYRQNVPTDVKSQIDIDVLKRLLNNHREAISKGSTEQPESSFERYIFYVDNQKSDLAALCLTKEEHDFKMPRLLLDFMMLTSNAADAYDIRSAIDPPTINTKCFSIGFAESMYYYPDVERYYTHADKRDILKKILFDSDDTFEDTSKKSMDLDKHPFGLRSRQNKLSEIYDDIPFSEDVNSSPESADYKIDKIVIELMDLLNKEREKEIDDFYHSPRVLKLNERIQDLDGQISVVKKEDGESTEEYQERAKELHSEKEKISEELNNLITSFVPNCPVFIDRSDIYVQLSVTPEEEVDHVSQEKSSHYRDLISFIKSPDFSNYVKGESGKSSERTSIDSVDETLDSNKRISNNSGCLSKLFFWWKNRTKENAEQHVYTKVDPSEKDDNTKKITDLCELLKLKESFRVFVEQVKDLEEEYNRERKYCEDFELMSHENHFYHLIDINKLRDEQSSNSSQRLDSYIKEWRQETIPTISSLMEYVQKQSLKYTTDKFAYIDWNNPFSFVKNISIENELYEICNTLQQMSSPFVNYNVALAQNQDREIYRIYSDRPNFVHEIASISDKIAVGNKLSVTVSKHIVSKICMIQFLPMDDDILNNLVDLQGQDEVDVSNVVEVAKSIAEEEAPKSSSKGEPPVIDWGEH